MNRKITLGYVFAFLLLLLAFVLPASSQSGCWRCEVIGSYKCFYEYNDCDLNPVYTCACAYTYCWFDPTCPNDPPPK